MKEFKHFINGEFVTSALTFENRCPADNSVIGTVYEAGKEEVDAAVRAAKAAMKGPWGKLSVNARVELLYKVADRINERFEDFC